MGVSHSARCRNLNCGRTSSSCADWEICFRDSIGPAASLRWYCTKEIRSLRLVFGFTKGQETEDDKRSGRPSTSGTEEMIEKVRQLIQRDRRMTIVDGSRSDWLLAVPYSKKWASRGSVSQPWKTSKRMRRPNSGRFQKKPSAGASNNGRIDGLSVYVGKSPTLKVIR